MHREGWVYVLENKAFPGLLKIGYTTRTPEIRAEELSQPTGVPAPYRVVFKRWFADCIAAERHMHRTLEHRRSEKEFFRIGVDEAIRAIEEYQPSKRLVFPRAYKPSQKSAFPQEYASLERPTKRSLAGLILVGLLFLVLIVTKSRIDRREPRVRLEREIKVTQRSDTVQADNEPLVDDAVPLFMEMVLSLENEMEGEAPQTNPSVFFTENEDTFRDIAFAELPKDLDETDNTPAEVDRSLLLREAGRGTLVLTESDDMLFCIRQSQY